ncbi:MAG: LPS export ABC transporter periplasmic protein LptC [Gallionella sp.]|nr:LPS export ABC transporter periplasmic protein LptC [Gallionella sp.]
MDAQRITSKLRSWLPLLPLLGLLLASYWLNLQVQPLPSSYKEARHDVDFTIEKLSSTVLNEKGQTRFVLSADKMWHFSDDDTTHLELPRFISLNADQPPVDITAKVGTLSSKSEEVFMHDDVVIARTDPVTLNEMRFETDYLHIVPDRDLAETDHSVLMYDEKNIVSAVGMVFDNQSRIVRLLSKVRAKHAPKK